MNNVIRLSSGKPYQTFKTACLYLTSKLLIMKDIVHTPSISNKPKIPFRNSRASLVSSIFYTKHERSKHSKQEIYISGTWIIEALPNIYKIIKCSSLAHNSKFIKLSLFQNCKTLKPEPDTNSASKINYHPS